MRIARNTIAAGFAGLAMFVVPGLAEAAQGFIASQTSLRAGPGGQFPYVDQLPAGAPVTVFGCLGGRSWCDVSFRGDRGWVSGSDLEIIFHSRRVRIVEVTETFVPVETFSVAIYWDHYYRGKPFYAERNRFTSVNININGGGKGASGRMGEKGQATASVGGSKGMEGKTGSTKGHLMASGNNGCPAGHKECKPGKGGAGMTGSASAGGTGGKTANAGKNGGGAVTGSMGSKGMQKKCPAGEASCGHSGGNAGSGSGGNAAAGGAPAQ
jgi:uncharacterized protein YraI